MRIAIVEDEAVVARRLERMVRDFAGPAASIEVAPSLAAAVEIIRQPLDLLFLDLNLGGRDGFSLLEEAAASPFQTVIVSAHHDQALRAFDYGVTDFVPKPWSEARLRTAFDRATGREPHGQARKLVIRKGRELRTVDVSEVMYVRGADDYAELHLADSSVHLHEKSLTALEALLPREFARVHRSYIANLGRVRGVTASALVLDDGSVIPLGRSSRAAVRQRLGVG
ncbi:MAG TPA: LytTR family DNA-binding domain-containing protein [Thermoanaerobaculia bacterium]|nr:LytTR family DNA-binding domain-containing protein [Thermoanaerobaculia bacterium]